jgi:hypothetical protein
LGTEQEVFLRYKDQEVVAHIGGHAGAGNYGLCFAVSDPGFWGNVLVEPLTETDPLLITNCEQFGHAIVPEIPPKSEERRGERRRSPRIIIRQAKACVESLAAGQEVVELINISRGGLCFRSDRGYPLKTWIRVAAPYTPNNTNVFVQAKIVRITREVWGNLYGAEYVQ